MAIVTGNGGSGGGQHVFWVSGNSPGGGYWVSSTTPSGGASQGTGNANVGAYWTNPHANTAAVSSNHRAIEDAGIRAGEIIGYRAWWLDKNGFLHSMYVADHRWEPDKVERANSHAYAWRDDGRRKLALEFHGVGYHAYKSLKEVKESYTCSPHGRVVYGQVAMWGDVMECERGYRSEYAKVHKIIGFAGPTPLMPWRLVSLLKLRRRYGAW